MLVMLDPVPMPSLQWWLSTVKNSLTVWKLVPADSYRRCLHCTCSWRKLCNQVHVSVQSFRVPVLYPSLSLCSPTTRLQCLPVASSSLPWTRSPGVA